MQTQPENGEYIEQPEEVALVPVDHKVLLAPVMNIDQALQRLTDFQKFVHGYLKDGEDYGTIPGTPKPTLYKSGADKLCELYGLSDDYEFTGRLEDWNKEPALFDYEVKCILRSKRDGTIHATGLGSCNSYEGKYRWREKKAVCPKCNKDSIIKGKAEYGGGWLCWKKQGGCGAKFAETDEAITKQELGKIPNDDIATLKNTILKMAKKRAKVDATLAATRSSGLFTQDMDDLAATPTDAPAQLASALCADCGDDVYSAEEVKEAKLKFGRTLCRICARKAKPLVSAEKKDDLIPALKKSVEIAKAARADGIAVDFTKTR